MVTRDPPSEQTGSLVDTQAPSSPTRPIRRTALDMRPPRVFQRPNTALLVAEPTRAVSEIASFTAALPTLRKLPKGDGRPVLVLPGFTASDASTQILRRWLRSLNYNPFGWKLGVNLGPTPAIVDAMFSRFATIRRQTGQPLTLIGWSLGGLYARALAERYPNDVRHVITLGSPFRLSEKDQTNAGALFEVLNGRHLGPHDVSIRSDGYRGAPTMASTAIFSRTDGIVPWRACIDEPSPSSENVEVRGSHTGLGHNPSVLLVLANRLRLELGAFEPFVETGHTCFPAVPYKS